MYACAMRRAQLLRFATRGLCLALFAAPLPALAQQSASPEPSAAPVEHTIAAERNRPAPPAPGYGRLRVAVNRPDTEVIVDGHSVGVAPLDQDLLRGPHLIRLESPGFKDWQGSVDIDEGALTPLRVMLRATQDRSAGIMTLTIAALVLGAGAATGIVSNLDHAALEADRNAGRLDNHDPRIDQGAILAGGADACFLLGAVLAAAGIYLVAHDPTSPSIGHVGRTHRILVGAEP